MSIERILLLVPPAITFRGRRDINPLPPLGLGYLAAAAEAIGVTVRIVDTLMEGWAVETPVAEDIVRVGLSDAAITEHLTKFNPDLIGVSCHFSRQHRVYRDLFRLIKTMMPSAITVAGGAHVTVCPEDVLSDPNCDIILTGEADDSFKALITCLNGDGELSGIDGIGFKTTARAVILPKTRWIEDLDRIPFPAYHLMHLERYRSLEQSHGVHPQGIFSPIVTSRGCPAKCTFCSAKNVWGSRYRQRSVANVIEELRLLRSTYGISEIMFEDDNVTAGRKRAKALFRAMIDADLGLRWDTPNGVGAWTIDLEMLELMKASGCRKLNLPVESGSQRVLNDIIRKPLRLRRIRDIAAHCKKIGLPYGMFLVIGMPGETLEDMWRSFRFAAACGVYTPHISVATPYPGTDLFRTCVENGHFARPFTLDDLFIRSFLIETPEWDTAALKRVLVLGETYLLLRHMTAEPIEIGRFILRNVRRPARLLANLRRLLAH